MMPLPLQSAQIFRRDGSLRLQSLVRPAFQFMSITLYLSICALGLTNLMTASAAMCWVDGIQLGLC